MPATRACARVLLGPAELSYALYMAAIIISEVKGGGRESTTTPFLPLEDEIETWAMRSMRMSMPMPVHPVGFIEVHFAWMAPTRHKCKVKSQSVPHVHMHAFLHAGYHGVHIIFSLSLMLGPGAGGAGCFARLTPRNQWARITHSHDLSLDHVGMMFLANNPLTPRGARGEDSIPNFPFCHVIRGDFRRKKPDESILFCWHTEIFKEGIVHN